MKRFSLSVALCVSTPLVILASAHAEELVCPQGVIEQLTFDLGEESQNPTISADGRCIAFISSGNPTGENPGGIREVFLYRANTITQITQGSNPGLGSQLPVVSADCSCIAFESQQDFTGQNPTFLTQLYVHDIAQGSLDQVTDFTEFTPDLNPDVNADCSLVAFSSSQDPVSLGAESNNEIYSYRRNSDSFSQITDEPSGESTNPSVSADGTVIAFQSEANIDGGNPSMAIEIYVANTDTDLITQITNGNDPGEQSTDPSISADGKWLAFESSANLVGENPDGEDEIWVTEIGSGVLTKVTDWPERSIDPSLSGDGNRIGFRSEADIVGGNPDNTREIFLLDIPSAQFVQISEESSGASEDPALDFDGTRITFESDSDINGGNPPQENDQIFLAGCFDAMKARGIPTLPDWALFAIAGLVGMAGLIAVKTGG